MVSLMEPTQRRLRLDLRGAVQGVGFRPFVFRLATELCVRGWIVNDPEGVRIEAEGEEGTVVRFAARLQAELPAHAAIHELSETWLEPSGCREFEIRPSETLGPRTAVVLPDLATCVDCQHEVANPADRRYGYPFTNCTHCGPRFSIIRELPYDRPNTTMAGFTMCSECATEYGNPLNRRFHAQPSACPACGPQLALWDPLGQLLVPTRSETILQTAARALREGRILATQGIGGFHLMVDARSEDAVALLRKRKARPSKPLALMAGSVDQVRLLCELSAAEQALLSSPEAPILLLERRSDAAVADAVAPGNPRLGMMLPNTPLHHLLLAVFGGPVVATSGNLSEEPICTDPVEAVGRLGEIADLFLIHDRPIERHVDDSIAWMIRGAPQVLRRARGYAPLPVRLRTEVPTILAVGAHLKNAVALGIGRHVFVSQHIGDLDTLESRGAFERVIRDFLRLYEAEPVAIAHDLHPDYASTAWAHLEQGLPEKVARIGVQHHHAHLASCLAENHATGPALGIIWDGTGYGAIETKPDGTVWGGEFLLGDAAHFSRFAHLRPFRLPGGEAAVREPRRAALALLWELMGEAALEQEELAAVRCFTLRERRSLGTLLQQNLYCPTTTSMGRLFDAVAALLGLCQHTRFEGEAAMALEFAADPSERGAYSLALRSGTGAAGPEVLDWAALIEDLLRDAQRGVPVPTIAARFHNTLVDAMVTVATQAGTARIALSGGCFQNRWLAERGAAALEREGFEVLRHRQVPPNDGGVSLGQVTVAAARLASSRE